MDDPLWPRASNWLVRPTAEPALSVVGVPTSVASISPSEAWRTPARFREVLAGFSTFHGELEIDLDTLDTADLGDWDVAGLDLEGSQDEIERRAAALARGPVHAFIGGDNAITRPLLRGLAGDELDRVGVLTFDAHHDVRGFHAGPTNGTPIRGLIEDGLPDGRVVQIGIHTFANSRPYRDYCAAHDIRVVSMSRVSKWGIEEAVAWALEGLVDRGAEWVYVDFDLDVLDRSFAPACPGARPGGMTPRQLSAAAYLAGRSGRVRAADFVEVDASRDVNDETVMNLCAAFLAFASGLATREW